MGDLSRVFQVEISSVFLAMKQDGITVTDEKLTLAQVAKVTGKKPRQLLKYFFSKKASER